MTTLAWRGSVLRRLGVRRGCFRGMEMVVENRTPEDAAQIVQRICGVLPGESTPTRPPSRLRKPTASRSRTTRASSATCSRAVPAQPHPVVLQPGCPRLREPAANALKDRPGGYLRPRSGCRRPRTATSSRSRIAWRTSPTTASCPSSPATGSTPKGTAYQLPLSSTSSARRTTSSPHHAGQACDLRHHRRQVPHVAALVPGSTAFVPPTRSSTTSRASSTGSTPGSNRVIPISCHAVARTTSTLSTGAGLQPLRRLGACSKARATTPATPSQMANRYLPMGVIDDSSACPTCRKTSSPIHGPLLVRATPQLRVAVLRHREPGTPNTTSRTATRGSNCPAYDGKLASGLSASWPRTKRNVPFVVERVDGLLRRSALPADRRRAVDARPPPSVRSRRSTSPAS